MAQPGCDDRLGLLAQVHAVLVGMLRGDPTLILDSCSVQTKRGTKDPLAVTGDGVPVAGAVTAANVNDTLVFERLFLAAFAALARLQTAFADKGSSAGSSGPSRASTSTADRTDRGWANGAGRSSAAMPGSWRTNAWRYAMTSSASSFSLCLSPYASSWLQAVWLANCENRF